MSDFMDEFDALVDKVKEDLKRQGFADFVYSPRYPLYVVDLRLTEDLMPDDKSKTELPPVDRTAVTTLHGTPVNELRAKQAKQKTGMHDDYIILTEEERKKGFVRPVRTAYKHLKCGAVTRMNLALSETYARDPSFYGATYCATCGTHFPVGEDGEFIWDGTDEKVGT